MFFIKAGGFLIGMTLMCMGIFNFTCTGELNFESTEIVIAGIEYIVGAFLTIKSVGFEIFAYFTDMLDT